MPRLQPRPGRKTTRRLEEPRVVATNRFIPTPLAGAMADAHNTAVREYGSDCGGFCAFDPTSRSWTVWDGSDGYPDGAVVTRLEWGRIDTRLAQCLLEGDGFGAAVSETKE